MSARALLTITLNCDEGGCAESVTTDEIAAPTSGLTAYSIEGWEFDLMERHDWSHTYGMDGIARYRCPRH